MQKATKIPTIRFQIKSKQKERDLIYLVFQHAGKRFKYTTGEHALVKYWERGKVKNSKSYTEASDINRRLTNLKSIVSNYLHSSSYHSKLTSDEIRVALDVLTKRVAKEEQPTFLEYFSEKIERRKNDPNDKKNTTKNFVNAYNRFNDFQSDERYIVDYDSINWVFLDRFVHWAYSVRSYSANTLNKFVKVIKQILKETHKLGYHENTIFQHSDFNVKTVKTKDKARLTEGELMLLEKYDFGDCQWMDRTRDLMLAGCYTGLRISDWKQITKENLSVKEGVELLSVVTKKTKTLVHIPILSQLKKLLEKYDYKLPFLTKQVFNRQIKKVCEHVGIKAREMKTKNIAGQMHTFYLPKYKMISSHCARRTFATKFIELNYPVHLIMQILGHSTQKQFFEYVDIDGQKLAIEFAIITAKRAQERKLKVA